MENQELFDEIDKWNNIFSSTTTIDPTLYELAFFKVFIKFEKFLSDCFEKYAVGLGSSSGYLPNRRLNFDDLDHLNRVIKKENISFVNHYEVIKKLSDCFFHDNPFEIIKSDPTFTTIIGQMKIIRDYIAHESTAAKTKYITTILNNRPFIEPHVHLLLVKRNTSKSFYT
jgi:hypothetical protein